MDYHRIPPFIPGNRRATALFCPVPNIPGHDLPVQIEYYKSETLFTTANGFNAVRTFPKVSTETVLDPWSGRVGVTGGAA